MSDTSSTRMNYDYIEAITQRDIADAMARHARELPNDLQREIMNIIRTEMALNQANTGQELRALTDEIDDEERLANQQLNRARDNFLARHPRDIFRLNNQNPTYERYINQMNALQERIIGVQQLNNRRDDLKVLLELLNRRSTTDVFQLSGGRPLTREFAATLAREIVTSAITRHSAAALAASNLVG